MLRAFAIVLLAACAPACDDDTTAGASMHDLAVAQCGAYVHSDDVCCATIQPGHALPSGAGASALTCDDGQEFPTSCSCINGQWTCAAPNARHDLATPPSD